MNDVKMLDEGGFLSRGMKMKARTCREGVNLKSPCRPKKKEDRVLESDVNGSMGTTSRNRDL